MAPSPLDPPNCSACRVTMIPYYKNIDGRYIIVGWHCPDCLPLMSPAGVPKSPALKPPSAYDPAA